MGWEGDIPPFVPPKDYRAPEAKPVIRCCGDCVHLEIWPNLVQPDWSVQSRKPRGFCSLSVVVEMIGPDSRVLCGRFEHK